MSRCRLTSEGKNNQGEKKATRPNRLMRRRRLIVHAELLTCTGPSQLPLYAEVCCVRKGYNGRLNLLVKHWLMEKVGLLVLELPLNQHKFHADQEATMPQLFLYVLTEFQRPIQLMAFLLLVALYRQLMQYHIDTSPICFSCMRYATALTDLGF